MITGDDAAAGDAAAGGVTACAAAANSALGLRHTTPGSAGLWRLTSTIMTDQLRRLADLTSPASPLSAASHAYGLGLIRDAQRAEARRSPPKPGGATAADPGTMPGGAERVAPGRPLRLMGRQQHRRGVIRHERQRFLVVVLSSDQPTEARGIDLADAADAAARAAVSALTAARARRRDPHDDENRLDRCRCRGLACDVLLTIATTNRPATDLGYLLHKNPDRQHVAELPFGTAHVFYPQACEQRCEAALIVDVDSVGLVTGSRDRRPAGRFALAHYINDRPYAASSFLSVALARVFGTAMAGRSKERQDLADQAIPLELRLPAVGCRGGPELAGRLFRPLGYAVEARQLPLDPAYPGWGASPYCSLRLTATARLRDALEHLYVLLPVLDDDKHYWVGSDEVAKLLRRGGDWLAAHPHRDLITHRYLRRDQRLTREALARLFADEGDDPDNTDRQNEAQADHAQRRAGLAELRMESVIRVIRETGAASVADLGCGSGRLLRELLAEPGLRRIVGMDVSHRALQAAARRLNLDEMAPRQRERIELLHGSLTYNDSRLRGFDAAVLVEVIEHLDSPRLGAFERAVFGHARPAKVVLTTPNAEYNALFEGLAPGEFRHGDHRFEWTREQLADWAAGVADRNGYLVELSGIGPEAPGLGRPSQLAVFRR